MENNLETLSWATTQASKQKGTVQTARCVEYESRLMYVVMLVTLTITDTLCDPILQNPKQVARHVFE